MTRSPSGPTNPPDLSEASSDPVLDPLLRDLPDPPLDPAVDRATRARALAALAAGGSPWRQAAERAFSLGLTGLAAAQLVWVLLSFLSLYQ